MAAVCVCTYTYSSYLPELKRKTNIFWCEVLQQASHPSVLELPFQYLLWWVSESDIQGRTCDLCFSDLSLSIILPEVVTVLTSLIQPFVCVQEAWHSILYKCTQRGCDRAVPFAYYSNSKGRGGLFCTYVESSYSLKLDFQWVDIDIWNHEFCFPPLDNNYLQLSL